VAYLNEIVDLGLISTTSSLCSVLLRIPEVIYLGGKCFLFRDL